MPKNDDQEIWAAYAKGVKPINGVKKNNPAKKKIPRPQSAKNNPLPKKENPAAVEPASVSFNRRAERNLRQGDVTIDARLDLHGMRQDEAHGALHAFIARQIKAGHRTLLIITGKGRNGPGVLRANLAGWLAASLHAPSILALRPASLKHGGEGAFYVLLKRRKDNRD